MLVVTFNALLWPDPRFLLSGLARGGSYTHIHTPPLAPAFPAVRRPFFMPRQSTHDPQLARLWLATRMSQICES